MASLLAILILIVLGLSITAIVNAILPRKRKDTRGFDVKMKDDESPREDSQKVKP